MKNSKCHNCKYVTTRFTTNHEFPSNQRVFNCSLMIFIDELELRQTDCDKYKSNKNEPQPYDRFR